MLVGALLGGVLLFRAGVAAALASALLVSIGCALSARRMSCDAASA